MIIAVDFDGTLCENNYPGIGAPKLNVINTIKKMQAEGHEFILWTCRVDDLLNDALKFLEDHDLHFSKINQDSDFFLDKYEGRPEVNCPKGRYLMACSGVHLCSCLDNEIKFGSDFEFMMRGRVIYVPSKEEIKSPLCKLQKFSFENEYRFIFPKITHPYVFHLKPIPGIIFDLEDNCKVIYNSIRKNK